MIPDPEYPAIFDVIIIGGGPAGMTAAIYAARRKMKALIITGKTGGQMMWSSDIENYTGVGQATGPELTKIFFDHVKKVDADNDHFDLWVREEEKVLSIISKDNLFFIESKNKKNSEPSQEFLSHTIVITTGKIPRTLNIPGESIAMKGNGLSFCATCDAPLYYDKHMAIIGGGNSAMDVAIQLSSGIDSTLVGAISKHELGFEPHAFTVGIKDSIQSESNEAEKIAKDLNFKHDTLYIEASDFFDIMKKHTDIYDEPFADSSSIPTYFLNKKVNELGYRVLLAGDGGDEFWLGYNRYMHAVRIQKLYNLPLFKNILGAIVKNKFIQKGIYSLFSKKYDLRQFDYRLSQMKKILKTNNANEYYDMVITQGNNSKLIDFNTKTYTFFQSKDILSQLSVSDAKYYMQGDIFVKNDRASMANSIETRSPLVDIDLVKYALSVNNSDKIINKETKYPLRKLLKEIYPKYDFNMPKKGFGIPLFDWLKIDYIKNEVINTIEILNNYDIFNKKYVTEVTKNFYKNGHPNAYQIWNLYLLAQFLDKNNLKNINIK